MLITYLGFSMKKYSGHFLSKDMLCTGHFFNAGIVSTPCQPSLPPDQCIMVSIKSTVR